MVKHPYVQEFANRASKYLKLKSTRETYQDEFDKRNEKKERRISKRKLEHQAEAVFDAETLLAGIKKMKKMKEKIAAEQQESSSSSIQQCSNDRPIPSSSKTAKSIKETIYGFGKAIHEDYTQGKTLTGEEMKAMKCGLSCILDLSETEEDITRYLLEQEVWAKLVKKYKKLCFTIPSLDTSLQEKWEVISSLVTTENKINNAEKYISVLRSKQDASNEKQHILDFFNEIIYLVDCNKFLLNPLNHSKVSERDFAYQTWLPLFKRLFHINNNLVRIKVGETVLSGSTASKSDLYHDHNNVIGFKVDIRILFDFNQDEFDIVCGEACIPLPGYDKLNHDMSKLLREGKLMQTTLQNIIIDPKESISWITQLAGPTCSFYTSHNTKYGEYHVNMPQFTVTFQVHSLNYLVPFPLLKSYLFLGAPLKK